jgi:hypothetical protein
LDRGSAENTRHNPVFGIRPVVSDQWGSWNATDVDACD